MKEILLSTSRVSESRFYRYCSEFPRRAVKITANRLFLLDLSFSSLLFSFVDLDSGLFLFPLLSKISSPKPDIGSMLEKFSSRPGGEYDSSEAWLLS